MLEKNIEQLDFVYVIGDAYVDHPSFGPAIISRVLESHGYTVGIISQPDWKDESSKLGLVGLRLLHKSYRELEKKYPEKCKVIRKCLSLLEKCEQRGEENIDITARYFGKLMGELFVYKNDVWEKTLRNMGFYLGKFIYIMDAFDDVEKDLQKDNYNALIPLYKEEDFEEKCAEMLNFILAECTSQFEKLPCVEDAEILRNILYAGVWDKFDKKRKEKKDE